MGRFVPLRFNLKAVFIENSEAVPNSRKFSNQKSLYRYLKINLVALLLKSIYFGVHAVKYTTIADHDIVVLKT